MRLSWIVVSKSSKPSMLKREWIIPPFSLSFLKLWYPGKIVEHYSKYIFSLSKVDQEICQKRRGENNTI